MSLFKRNKKKNNKCRDLSKEFECDKCSKTLIIDEHGCVSGGAVGKVFFGYGSEHDLRWIEMAICDKCASKHPKLASIETVSEELHNIRKALENENFPFATEEDMREI